MNNSTKCLACSSSTIGATHIARERWFGMPGTFTYAECGDCGSLSLVSPPKLDEYYPDNYYSISPSTRRPTSLVETIRQKRQLHNFIALTSDLGLAVPKDARILDVGSGNGALLLALESCGYTSLSGVDKFVSGGFVRSRLQLIQGTIDEIEGSFDLVMFNHSLEHVIDPVANLQHALRLVATGGAILVRIPVKGWAWDHYGACWVGLDAPRHIFIPTLRGFGSLVSRAGGNVAKHAFDSTGLQFWASEAYQRGKTLHEITAGPIKLLAAHLIGELQFGRRARILNQLGQGDQACFLIQS